jgi:O-antigen/teichoic acid export membrane protein
MSRARGASEQIRRLMHMGLRPNGSLWPLLRLGSVIASGNVLTALFRVVSLRIYTHLLTAQAFGTANLVLGVLALGFQVCIQPVASTQLRYHTEATRSDNGDGFTVQALRWALAAAGIVAAVVVVGFALWPAEDSATASVAMMAAAVAWILVSTVRTVFSVRLHAEQRMRSYIWLRVVEGGLIAALTSLALLAWPGAEAFVWGQVAAILVALVATCLVAPWPTLSLLARLAEPDRGTPRFWPNLRRYGAPFAPMSALQWLGNMGDRYVLASILGAAAVGQYLAAFTLASYGFLLANGMMTDLFRPKLFDAESAGARERAKRIFLAWLAAYAAVSLFGLAALALLGDWIVWLLLAAPYRAGAVQIMLWIAVGYALNGLTLAFENRLYSLGRSAASLPPLAVGGLCNVGFSLVLVPWHGVFGAAEANALSFAVRLMLTGIILRGALKSPRNRAA